MSFYTHLIRHKTLGFLTFSVNLGMEHWAEMSYVTVMVNGLTAIADNRNMSMKTFLMFSGSSYLDIYLIEKLS